MMINPTKNELYSEQFIVSRDNEKNDEGLSEKEKKVVPKVFGTNNDLFNVCLKNGVINESGLMTNPHEYSPLPVITTDIVSRLNSLLNKPIQFENKDISKIPEYKRELIINNIKYVYDFYKSFNMYSPLIINRSETSIKIRLNANLQELFLFLLDQNQGVIEEIELYGGTVPRLLGKAYYKTCLKQLTKQLHLEPETMHFCSTFEAGRDVDFRILVPHASANEMLKIEFDILHYFSASIHPEIRGLFIEILREIVFTKKANVYRQEEGGLNDYYLRSFGKGVCEIDLSIIKSVSHKELFLAHGLSIEIKDLLNSKTRDLRPSGTLCDGWQSLFDRLAKIMTVTNINHPYYQGWEKSILFLTRGYWMPDEHLQEKLIQFAAEKEPSILIPALDKVFAAHLNQECKNWFVGYLNAAIMLHEFSNYSKISNFFIELQRMKGKEFSKLSWFFLFSEIINREILNFFELIHCFNFIFLLKEKLFQCSEKQISYQTNKGKEFYLVNFDKKKYLHIPKLPEIDFKIIEKIMQTPHAIVHKFMERFCGKVIKPFFLSGNISCQSFPLNYEQMDGKNTFITFLLFHLLEKNVFSHVRTIICGLELLKHTSSNMIKALLVAFFKKHYYTYLRGNSSQNLAYVIENISKIKEYSEVGMHLYLYTLKTSKKMIHSKLLFVIFNNLCNDKKILFLKELINLNNSPVLIYLSCLSQYLDKQTGFMSLQEYGELQYIYKRLLKLDPQRLLNHSKGKTSVCVFLLEKSLYFHDMENCSEILKLVEDKISENQQIQLFLMKYFKYILQIDSIGHFKVLMEWVYYEKKQLFGLIKNEEDYFTTLSLVIAPCIEEKESLQYLLQQLIYFPLQPQKIIKNTITSKICEKNFLSKEESFLLYEADPHYCCLLKMECLKNQISKENMSIVTEELLYLLNTIDSKYFNKKSAKILQEYFFFATSLHESMHQKLLTIYMHPSIKEIFSPKDAKTIYFQAIKRFEKKAFPILKELFPLLELEDAPLFNDIFKYMVEVSQAELFKTDVQNHLIFQKMCQKLHLLFKGFNAEKEHEKVTFFANQLSILNEKTFYTYENSEMFLHSYQEICLNRERKQDVLSRGIDTIVTIVKKDYLDENLSKHILTCISHLSDYKEFYFKYLGVFDLFLLKGFACAGITKKIFLKVLNKLTKFSDENLLWMYLNAVKKNDFLSEKDFFNIVFQHIKKETFSIRMSMDFLYLIDNKYIQQIEKENLKDFLQEITLKVAATKKPLYFQELINYLEENMIIDGSIIAFVLEQSEEISPHLTYNFFYKIVFKEVLFGGSYKDIIQCLRLLSIFAKQDPNYFVRQALKNHHTLKKLFLLSHQEMTPIKNEFLNILENYFFKNFKVLDEDDLMSLIDFKTNFKSVPQFSNILNRVDEQIVSCNLKSRSLQDLISAGNIVIQNDQLDKDIIFTFMTNIPKELVKRKEVEEVLEKVFVANDYLFLDSPENCIKICEALKGTSNKIILESLAKFLLIFASASFSVKLNFLFPLIRSMIHTIDSDLSYMVLKSKKIQKSLSEKEIACLWGQLLSQINKSTLQSKKQVDEVIYFTMENLHFIVKDEEALFSVLNLFVELLFLNRIEKNDSFISFKDVYLHMHKVLYEKILLECLQDKKLNIWEDFQTDRQTALKISFFKKINFKILELFFNKTIKTTKLSKEALEEIIVYSHYLFSELVKNYQEKGLTTLSYFKKYIWFILKNTSNEAYFNFILDASQSLCFKIENAKDYANRPIYIRTMCMMANSRVISKLSPSHIYKYYSPIIRKIKKIQSPMAIKYGFILLSQVNNYAKLATQTLHKLYNELLDAINFNPYTELNVLYTLMPNQGASVAKESTTETETYIDIMIRLITKTDFKMNYNINNLEMVQKVSFIDCIIKAFIDDGVPCSGVSVLKVKHCQIFLSFLEKLLELEETYPLPTDLDAETFHIGISIFRMIDEISALGVFDVDWKMYFHILSIIKNTLYNVFILLKNELGNEILDRYEKLFFKSNFFNTTLVTDVMRIAVLHEYIMFLLDKEELLCLQRAKKLFERAIKASLYKNGPSYIKLYFDNLKRVEKIIEDKQRVALEV